MSADSVDAAERSMTVKEAVALLTSLQASQVLPILRHPDFMMVAGLAFAGFRQDAGGYANPIVRRRLAEEAAKNFGFAEKLRNLSKQPKPEQATIISAPINSARSTNHQEVAFLQEREAEKYRLERDRLKQERDAAIAARQSAERLLTESKRQLITAQTVSSEHEKELERVRQRLERVERKQRQLETTNAALRRSAVLPGPITQQIPPTGQGQISSLSLSKSESNHYFADAVRHLLSKQKQTTVLSIVADVLRAAPGDVEALAIKADALIQIDKKREAIAVLRTLIPLRLARNEISEASMSLGKLLRNTQKPDLESKTVREFMSALPRSSESLEKVAEPLLSLRGDNPSAFEFIRSLTPAAWINQLFPEQSRFDQDTPLPLVVPSLAGLSMTPRKLIVAINRNDWPIVELTQDALRDIATDEKTQILESITRAANGDPIFAQVLTPSLARGPIVVDCSNVAWHGQEHQAQQQPRLAYVISIRRALWRRGYFPVVLIADANFPFVINEPTQARSMVDDEQIHLVLGGSDADEQILREAKRLNAPIVTNDYMVDWDPNQTATKLQYSFSPDGNPTVYF